MRPSSHLLFLGCVVATVATGACSFSGQVGIDPAGVSSTVTGGAGGGGGDGSGSVGGGETSMVATSVAETVGTTGTGLLDAGNDTGTGGSSGDGGL